MSPRTSNDHQNEVKEKESALEEVASNHEGIVIDDATQKRIVRKIDWYLMPVVRPANPFCPNYKLALLPCQIRSKYADQSVRLALLHVCDPILRQGRHFTSRHFRSSR